MTANLQLDIEIGYPVEGTAEKFIDWVDHLHILGKGLENVVDKKVVEGEESC